MFARWVAIAFLCLLAGCVDLGNVGLHPQLKEFRFSRSMNQLYRCLDHEAMHNDLRLEEDGSLSTSSRRFNVLDKDGVVVAWLDMRSSDRQTDVDLFYGRNDRHTEGHLMMMMAQCQKTVG